MTRVVVKTTPGDAKEIKEIKVVKENCKKKLEIENKVEEKEEAANQEAAGPSKETPPPPTEESPTKADTSGDEAGEENKEVINITTSKADSLTIIVN